LLSSSGIQEVQSIPKHLNYDFKFDFTSYQNKPVLGIGLQRTFSGDPFYKGSYALYLAFHEGFHLFIQNSKDWLPDSNFQRGDTLPGKVESRFYRMMLYENLKMALLKDENEVYLGKAAFWYNKWNREFPEEASQSVDRHEGVPTYYDTMAVTRSFLGCGANSKEVKSFLRENFDMFFEKPDGLSKEGYMIGGLAGIHLWILEDSSWQRRVLSGESPLTILFKKIEPITDRKDTEKYEEVKSIVEAKNEEIQQNLHGDLDNFFSKEYVRVLIPSNFYITQLPIYNIVIPQELPRSSIFITGDGYQASDQFYTSRIEALGPLPLFSGIEGPCENSGNYIVIEQGLIEEGEFSLSGANSYVKFKLKGALIDHGGIRWFCSK